MRCRVGDLAVIVRAQYAENIGRLCTVVAPFEPLVIKLVGPAWLTNGSGPGNWTYDADLRPIRPDEGQDETLRWLDVPSKETV